MASTLRMCPHRKLSRMCTLLTAAATAVTSTPARQAAAISRRLAAAPRAILRRPTRAAAAPALWSNTCKPVEDYRALLRGARRFFAVGRRLVMKLTTAILLISVSLRVYGQPATPAEQRIAVARQQLSSDPKKVEVYNDLALALISRAQETESADYDRQAA